MRTLYVLHATLASLAIGACGTLGPADPDPAACPQSGEFTNFRVPTV